MIVGVVRRYRDTEESAFAVGRHPRHRPNGPLRFARGYLDDVAGRPFADECTAVGQERNTPRNGEVGCDITGLSQRPQLAG